MSPAKAQVLQVPGPEGEREVRVSSPDRVLWPQEGITKLDLAQYVVDVAEPFLRANGDRPVALQRFPTGRSSSPRTRRAGSPTTRARRCAPIPRVAGTRSW